MEIIINDQRKIFKIKEEFNTFFPFLKLEFLSKPQKTGVESVKRILNNNNCSLGEFRNNLNNKKITITPDMTTLNLEQAFRDIYGLWVQVFRKSGKVWLATTVTDGWTLEEQNKQGEALCKTPE